LTATPVVVRAAGDTEPTHIHALVNVGRIGCYRPFLTAQPVSPVEMVERNLLACSYCWPAGIIWPVSVPPRSAP